MSWPTCSAVALASVGHLLYVESWSLLRSHSSLSPHCFWSSGSTGCPGCDKATERFQEEEEATAIEMSPRSWSHYGNSWGAWSWVRQAASKGVLMAARLVRERWHQLEPASRGCRRVFS